MDAVRLKQKPTQSNSPFYKVFSDLDKLPQISENSIRKDHSGSKEVSYMADENVLCVYESLPDLESALTRLKEEGYPMNMVSVISSDLQSEKEIHGYIAAGAGTGAWAGGIFGMLTGAAFVWLPGVGLTVIIGSLVSTLLGAAEGAIVGAISGGLLGSALGDALSKQQLGKYESMLRTGKHLLIAKGTAEQVRRAYDLLKDTNEYVLDLHIEKEIQPA